MKIQCKNRLHKMVMVGVFAAVMAVLSQISIPLPTGVPVTLQTFAVALCGYVLGVQMGGLALAVYLAIGAVGLPVFAGFSGGIGSFAGVTGGFLWGFFLMSLLCGLGAQQGRKWLALVLGLVGLAVCDLCGALQFSVVMSTSLPRALLTACLPYLVKDVISVVVGYFAAQAVLYALKKSRMVTEA